MVSYKLTEDKSYEHAVFDWQRISHSLQPETKVLSKEDRRFFETIIWFIVGKEVKLANIERRQYLFFKLFGDHILNLNSYPMLITKEYVRKMVAKFIKDLGLTISIDGLGWKFGPMGFQQQKVTQELIQPSVTPMR